MELESCALVYPLYCVDCYLISLKSMLTVHSPEKLVILVRWSSYGGGQIRKFY